MADEFKRLDRELVYKGSIVDFYKDTVKVPNGNVVKWDFIKHQGAAAVVPVMEDGRILMVRQYRNALDRYTLEIPAGGPEWAGGTYHGSGGQRIGGGNRLSCGRNQMADHNKNHGGFLQ